MAKFELKFKDYWIENDFIKAEFIDFKGDEKENLICITLSNTFTNSFEIYLDKSTAIKFAKTLRTEINKITESEEVNNG